MPIASLKAKIVPITQGASNDNLITKKIEVMSSNFKSTPTILARDLKIEGEISSSGLIEIEGIIKGKINGNSVILREEGFIEGEVIAESLSLRGTFEGKIKAKNVNIASKAKVHGEIEYESLSVEDGACIDGQFKKIK
jgi:cytoskeletal protein CcmA (bactofilin family)